MKRSVSNKLNALLVVVIGGALDAVSTELMDNKSFNFGTGYKHLISIALVGAIIAFAAMWNGRVSGSKKETKGGSDASQS